MQFVGELRPAAVDARAQAHRSRPLRDGQRRGQLLCVRRGQRGGVAAEHDERQRPRVDALLRRRLPDRVRHVRVDEPEDPVGRLVDPGQTYWAEDSFYLDVTTADPFLALEKYGRAMRVANQAHPKIYTFPVLCGWGVGAHKMILKEIAEKERQWADILEGKLP